MKAKKERNKETFKIETNKEELKESKERKN